MTMVLLIVFALTFGVMFWRLLLWSVARGRLFLWATFAAACAGPVIFDLAQHTYTIAVRRYAIAALPAAFLLAGLALSRFSRPAMRSFLLLLIVAAWMTGLLSIYRDRSPWCPIRDLRPPRVSVPADRI